jgi:hypothetical protein
MLILSTCWYKLNCKFNEDKYKVWIDNFLSNVKKFYLVVYTNQESCHILKKYENNTNIKIVILELNEFYNYKYRASWIRNHEKNYLLKNKICWEVNMLWSEKISFVKRTIEEKYFEGNWYGWCDIGYFRCASNYELKKHEIINWPNNDKIKSFDKDKVYYGNVRNDSNNMKTLQAVVTNKNSNNLPIIPISNNLWCIGGGFFIIHKDKINWWHDTYTNKLELYFKNNYLVKDDQIIIVDCIFSDLSNFCIVQDTTISNPWFIFQRYLL